MRSQRSSATQSREIQWTSARPTHRGQGHKASHAAGEGVDEIAETLVGVAEIVVRHLEHVSAGLYEDAENVEKELISEFGL